MSTTLILGGGFGGIACANELRARVPTDHRIVLIDKSPTFRVGATKTWLAIGHPVAESMEYRRDGLKSRGIEVIESEIVRIDPSSRTVQLSDGQTLVGDALVIALGADYAMNAVPGLAENAHTFYTPEGARRLKPALDAFRGGDVVVLIPRSPFKCPPGPYEGAMMIHDYFKRRGIIAACRMGVWTVEGAPMATAGPQVGQFVKDLLTERGIEFNPLEKTVRVEPGKVLFEDGEAPYDLLIAVPPHVAPPVVKATGLCGPSGWIPVEPKTLAVSGHEGVYAVGDINTVPLPGRFKPDVSLAMPKAGVAAASQGRVVASHIAARLSGASSDASFDGKVFCYMETGDMHAFKASGDFFAIPHPSMQSALPDMRQYESKVEWVREWVQEELGG